MNLKSGIDSSTLQLILTLHTLAVITGYDLSLPAVSCQLEMLEFMAPICHIGTGEQEQIDLFHSLFHSLVISKRKNSWIPSFLLFVFFFSASLISRSHISLFLIEKPFWWLKHLKCVMCNSDNNVSRIF